MDPTPPTWQSFFAEESEVPRRLLTKPIQQVELQKKLTQQQRRVM
jgi:hypothetical protein